MLGAVRISAFQMSSRLGMWSRRVLYYHGLLLRMHPGYSILCLTSIHFSQLRLLVRPLKSEQNGILECPSAMHPKAFFSFSWILLLIVFNISYQATGILNFEDKGESSGPLLAVLTRWSSGVALPYAFQTPGAACSPNISAPASGVIIHKCTYHGIYWEFYLLEAFDFF